MEWWVTCGSSKSLFVSSNWLMRRGDDDGEESSEEDGGEDGEERGDLQVVRRQEEQGAGVSLELMSECPPRNML